MFVTLPASQFIHVAALVAPVAPIVFEYLPGLQSSHAMVEVGEYVPGLHAVQFEPPLEDNVFVTLPGVQF